MFRSRCGAKISDGAYRSQCEERFSSGKAIEQTYEAGPLASPQPTRLIGAQQSGSRRSIVDRQIV